MHVRGPRQPPTQQTGNTSIWAPAQGNCATSHHRGHTLQRLRAACSCPASCCVVQLAAASSWCPAGHGTTAGIGSSQPFSAPSRGPGYWMSTHCHFLTSTAVHSVALQPCPFKHLHVVPGGHPHAQLPTTQRSPLHCSPTAMPMSAARLWGDLMLAPEQHRTSEPNLDQICQDQAMYKDPGMELVWGVGPGSSSTHRSPHMAGPNTDRSLLADPCQQEATRSSQRRNGHICHNQLQHLSCGWQVVCCLGCSRQHPATARKVGPCGSNPQQKTAHAGTEAYISHVRHRQRLLRVWVCHNPVCSVTSPPRSGAGQVLAPAARQWLAVRTTSFDYLCRCGC